MDKRLTEHFEYERYICNHFGDLNELSNKLYYKILKWEKKGMLLSESMAETKRWVINQIEVKHPSVEVHCKKWIHSIDVDWEAGTGKSEWIYLIETCGIIAWIRVEIDDLSEKILDIEDTYIIKYPSED